MQKAVGHEGEAATTDLPDAVGEDGSTVV